MNRSTWLSVPERKPKRRTSDAVLLSPLLVVSIGALVVAGLLASQDMPLMVAYCGVSGAAGLLVYRKLVLNDRRWRALAIRPEEAPMLPELDVREGVLVALWVLQGRAVTGYDRGAMWVEDGRLMFSGRHTSFVLTRDDVQGPTHFPKDGPGEIELSLHETTPAGPLRVAFTPLFGDRPYAKPLTVSLNEWRHASIPAQGPSQRPPREFGPGVPELKAIRRRRMVRAAENAAFAFFFVFPFVLYFGVAAFLPLIGGALFALGHFGRSVERRELRDRRALAQENP